MQAHHRRLLWNVQDHLCMRDGFGFLGTIDGTEAGMCGCVAVGSTRLDGELCGFPAAGCLAAGAMSTLPDLGGNAYPMRFHLTSVARIPGLKSEPPEFPVRSAGQDRVCAFLHGKAHRVRGTH